MESNVSAIRVEQVGQTPARFKVVLPVDGDRYEYDVVVTDDEFERYSEGAELYELVKATFSFLLERESAEEILEQFQLSDVEKYFPEYPDELPNYLE